MHQIAGGMARRAAATVSLAPFRLLSPRTPPISPSPDHLGLVSGFDGGHHLRRIRRMMSFESRGGRFGCSMVVASRPFCSSSGSENPSEVVKELHEKVLDSVKVKRSAPPNAWLWSMIDKCQNKDDIRFLFDALQHLRVFRLSNLRIHENFNCHLCQEVAKACARVGAIDLGMKALWKHNIYGLSPSVASANHLLSYAKIHRDPDLMVSIMKLIKTNDLPLQPATADIVFR
ncbi:hypothetical protein AKJ16_DCAP26124 [Drosera capensis]